VEAWIAVGLTLGAPARGDAGTPHSFTPELKLASFYTGGQLALTADGQVLITPCGDDIKVLDLATGVVKHTLPGVRPRCV